MLGEQFIVGNEICGVVISIRPVEDIIAIWNRTADDTYITGRIRLVYVIQQQYNLLLLLSFDILVIIDVFSIFLYKFVEIH